MSSGRSTDDLRARLQSLRASRQSSLQRQEPVREWGDTFQLDELEELQSMLEQDAGGYASSNAEEYDAALSSGLPTPDSPEVWRDTRPASHSYVDEPHDNQPIERQLSYRQPGLNPAVEETYEAAFRLIQLAAEAERSGHPLQAIQLYTDAGDVLIKVGKNEQDPLLKQGIREKANEIMKRAEELDQWYYSVQESARKAALPPQLQIQRTQVPRVQEAWQGRKPTLTQAPEFTHMRYTAVSTKDPVKFSDDGFQLRVEEAGKKIRVFITITMYNEEGSELQGTLTGIARNLEFMVEQWGDRAWESIAVAVVSDGRTKASSSCLDFLTGLGAFDEEIMTVTSIGVDVQLHLFEATVQLVRDDNFESFYPPIQLIYALKEHNAGKLNSHLWFFNAFSEQVLPTYTVLVDVGTIPGPTSIFKLIRSMDRNAQIGGVAGEIAVDHPNYFNPVIAAQHFEYKISNIMDKSLESALGFISVLPGAFSAYRYEAIRAEKGVGPLPEYFKSLTTSTQALGPFKGNMYLAEDRILCFELLARRGRNWTMHYVKDAIARTDVPETLVDLIKQRRRWLNGSFFAGLFAISNFSRVWKESGHTLSRKIVLTLQFIYLSVQNVLSWFLLSNLFLTFYYVLTLTLYSKYPALLAIILGIYLSIVGGIVVFALGNRPEKRTAGFYSFSYVFMGLVMLVVSVISIYGLVADASVTDPRDNLATCSVSNFELVGGVVTAMGLIFASAFIHGEFSVLLSTLHNLHDLSWGTKGLETAGHGAAKVAQGNGNLKEIVAQQKQIAAEKQRVTKEKEDVDNSFRAFRSSLLLFWLVTNAVWMYCMTYFVSSSCYLKFISYVVAVFNIVRFLGSAVFLCFRIARRLGTCGISRSGSVGRNYQTRLPDEWQAHYKRTSNATTEITTNGTAQQTYIGLNISDLNSPAATNYSNME
ncbi:unnamed protein product [Phytophthora fragariaefolia]|uniref:chitin synthase n=1 Tax=Phytophthora fragariaefolia TaxID=1490495 RepID=A0A9W6TTX0_9STRA|nr:unnamed protein product [Phytophthora fragariaefolia]